MNRLPIEKRAQIIGLLVGGMSMRAVTRVAGVSINTVTKLLEDVGIACGRHHAQVMVDLPCKRVQCDETWAFYYSKEKNVAPADKGVLGQGDVYTCTAICADTKLIPAYLVGMRDADYSSPFIADLASRLANRVQLTTDDHRPYLQGIEDAFGREVDFAQRVKHYGPGSDTDQRRCSQSSFVSAEKRHVTGNPDIAKVSTSYVEWRNLTTRMGMPSFTRLTNGFSKKVQSLEHAVSLHFMHYNFAHVHKTLRVTPAMAAGISDHVWTLEEIAELAP